jgi:electron transfer flavoprotein beta subunit
MKILVCVKHVPDTEAKVKIGADGRSFDDAGVKMIVSPYDEFALEEALLLRDAAGGEVVVASAGKKAAEASLRQALAMGADRAVLIGDDALDRADALTRARALAALARTEAADLVFTGKYGVGADEGQVGPMLAEVLDLPHAAGVEHLEVQGTTFVAHRAVEGAIEVLEGSVPAVVTWNKTVHEPRYPTLKGIMAAKKKPLEVKSASDLGLDAAELSAAPRVVWEALELPPSRKAGRRIEGEPAEAAKELVRILREEARVL